MKTVPTLCVTLLACLLAGSTASAAIGADKPGTPSAKQERRTSTIKPARYRTVGMPASAARTYALAWGVDQLSAKLAESGQVVRVSYRVTDADKAKALHDKVASPYLLDERVHAMLQVPVMEKVGPLRQAGPPEFGKSYWMVFSNKGSLVKAGHRVSVVIGPVRIDGLVVQP
jgi:ABC-type Fe3+-hydroxamate transport system substrate-binding protein